VLLEVRAIKYPEERVSTRLQAAGLRTARLRQGAKGAMQAEHTGQFEENVARQSWSKFAAEAR